MLYLEPQEIYADKVGEFRQSRSIYKEIVVQREKTIVR